MNTDQSVKHLAHSPVSKMVIPKRKLTKLLKIGGVICVVVIIGIFVTTETTLFTVFDRFRKTKHGIFGSSGVLGNNVRFNRDSKTLTFTDSVLNVDYLNIYFEYDLRDGEMKVTELCDSVDSRHSQNDEHDLHVYDTASMCSGLNLEFENGLHATVSKKDLDTVQCHSVEWYTSNKSSEITNCIYMEDDNINWYGGGGLSVQRWPLNRVNVPSQPHITQKSKSNLNKKEVSFDGFIEPYFVSSKGVSVLIDHYLPLFMSMNHQNDKKLCFTSMFKKPYASMEFNQKLVLKYLVCKDKTAKSVHQHLLKTSKIPFFHGSPDLSILQKPIWSTRGLDTANNINEAKVLLFVNDIKTRNLPYSYLFIDGNYSRSHGIFYFDEKKFPRSHQLIMELNSPGEDKFPVGTEVYPHTSIQEAKFFAVHYKNNIPEKLDPDQLYLLDVTNEDALKWYKSQLTDLTVQISLKGFRFSGGYAMDLLNGVDQSFLITNKTLYHPNIFTTKFAEVAAEVKGMNLIGSGYKSQGHTFVADAGPMMSSWEHNKGLKSIIPTVLTYGIMGYPFGLVGPVGGMSLDVASSNDLQTPPNKELYIRWLQLMAYLPVMELSIGPWMYGQEVVSYTQSLLSFRYKELWPNLLSPAVEEALKSGTPIARPLWWIAPDDKVAQFIDCEFILGDSLLVAPVLYEETRFRDVYLPEGSWWKDQLRGNLHKGGQWLRKYTVDLYEIATFKRDVDHQSL